VEEIYIHDIQSLEFIKLTYTRDARGTVQDLSSLLLTSLPWRQTSGMRNYGVFFSLKYSYSPPKRDKCQRCQLWQISIAMIMKYCKSAIWCQPQA